MRADMSDILLAWEGKRWLDEMQGAPDEQALSAELFTRMFG